MMNFLYFPAEQCCVQGNMSAGGEFFFYLGILAFRHRLILSLTDQFFLKLSISHFPCSKIQ